MALDEAAKLFAEGYSVYSTGGGAQELRPCLSADVKFVPELVLDGLSWLLP